MTLDEEVLEVGRRRSLRPAGRLVLACVSLVVAGVVVGWRLAGRDVVAGHPIAARPPSGHPAELNQDIAIPTGSPAVEVDGRLVVEAAGMLLWTSLSGSQSASTPIDDADGYQLVADPAQHRVWLLYLGAQPRIGYVPSTGPGLQVTGEFPAGVAGGTLLNGEFYVSSEQGVFQLALDGSSYVIDPVRIRGGRYVTADPVRNRLLLTDLDGRHASVRAQAPGDAAPERTAGLPFGKGLVVVAGQQIWAAGYGDHGAVLAQLDPTTLRVVTNSPLAPALGPGAEVVGAGNQVLLVRSGGGGDTLWCVDAFNGTVLESWPHAPGAVAVGPDGGYLVSSTHTAPTKLTGGACSG